MPMNSSLYFTIASLIIPMVVGVLMAMFPGFHILGWLVIGFCTAGFLGSTSLFLSEILPNYFGASSLRIYFVAATGLVGFLAVVCAMLWFDPAVRASASVPSVSKPELHLTISGGNVFIPTEMPTWTGIGLDVRIWNTGSPSVVTEWTMKITANGGSSVRAQLTAMPNVLNGSGPDLSPIFHPVGSRARPSFEPCRLGDATGWGAEPHGSSSDPSRCITGSLSLA